MKTWDLSLMMILMRVIYSMKAIKKMNILKLQSKYKYKNSRLILWKISLLRMTCHSYQIQFTKSKNKDQKNNNRDSVFLQPPYNKTKK